MLFWGIKCEMKTHLAKFSCMANTGKKVDKNQITGN